MQLENGMLCCDKCGKWVTIAHVCPDCRRALCETCYPMDALFCADCCAVDEVVDRIEDCDRTVSYWGVPCSNCNLCEKD